MPLAAISASKGTCRASIGSAPKDPRYQFKEFYERVKAKGFILYPGKLTQVETFRVGCIGHVNQAEMHAAVAAVAEVLREMEVLDC